MRDGTVNGARVIEGTSPTLIVLVWLFFAAFWLTMMALVTVVAWEKLRAEILVAAFIAVFWLAGLFLASKAVQAILRARRFGASTLVIDATPVALGGWISGVVRGPLAIQGADVELDVTCVRTSHHTRSSSGSSTSTSNLWRVTSVLDGTRLARQHDHVAIPFAVRIPADGEATRDERGGSDIDWWVGVKAAMPGVDYMDRFKVPVVAPEPGAAPAPDEAPREMPELAGERLAARLPGRLEYQADADVFVFPLKVSWVVWVLVLAAVAEGAPLLREAPLLAAIPWTALKWVAIVSGVLAVLSFVGLLFDTRRIEVRPESVRIRRGVLGLGFHRSIPRARIEAVDLAASTSDPPTHSVSIRLGDGDSYFAALAIPEPDRAVALATRLREILRLPPA